MIRAHTHRSRVYHLASTPRDYEAEFAGALRLLGYTVIDAAAYKKNKALHSDPCVVVTQYIPHPPSTYTGLPRNWKLDFAHPLTKTYVEIDGYHGDARRKQGAHTTWTGFHRDRERDRDLAFAGWRGLRYGPGHLAHTDEVLRCAAEFIRFIGIVGAHD